MNYVFRIMLNSIVHLETFFVLRVCYGTSCLVIKHSNLRIYLIESSRIILSVSTRRQFPIPSVDYVCYRIA